MNKLFYALLVVLICTSTLNAKGQQHQENGYHATEYYAKGGQAPSGDHNGYRASEAKCRSGAEIGSSHGGSERSGGGGFGGGFASRSSRGREESGFASRSGYAGGERSVGRRQFDASGYGQDSGSGEGIALAATRGSLRTAILQRDGQMGGTAYGAQASGYNSTPASYGQLLGSRMATREQAEQNMIQSGRGGFNRIYTGQ